MANLNQPVPTGKVDEVVELRVHGVGGSSPGGLLAHKDADQYKPPWKFAGDDITGFYRAEWDEKARGRKLEGYLWGGLTSRRASRALWLLLLPFSLANIAGWMVEPRTVAAAHPTVAPRKPDTKHVDPLARAQMGLIRLFSGGMTMLFLSWFGLLVVDQVAYQCGGQPECTAGRIWMTPFTAGLLADFPGRRLLVGAMLLLVLVALLAILTFRAQNRYERVNPVQQDTFFGRDGDGLSDPTFWASGEFVRRLSYFHLGLGVLTVAMLLSLSVDGLGTAFSVSVLSIALLALTFVYLALIEAVAALPDELVVLKDKLIHLVWLVPLAGFGLAGWAAWLADEIPLGAAPGMEPVFGRALLYIALCLLAVTMLIVLVRFLTWFRRPAKPRLVAAGATVFWLLVMALAVFWRSGPLQDRVDSRLIVGIASLGIVYLTWNLARRPDWRVVIAAIAVISTALLWVGGANAYRPFWVLAALTGLAAIASLKNASTLFRGILALVVVGAATAVWRITEPENMALQWLGLGVLGLSLLPTFAADVGRKDQWRWGGPIMPIGLSLIVLMVAASGSASSLADFLDRGEIDDCCAPVLAQPTIDFLNVYEVIALVLLGAIVMTGFGAGLHLLRIRADVWAGQRDAIKDKYVKAEPEEPQDHYDCTDAVVKKAVDGRALGSAARDADVFISTLVTIAVVAAVLGTLRILLGAGSDFFETLEQPPVSDEWKPWVRLAVVGAALLPAAGVAMIRNARKDEDVRRSLGTVWDVLTFWPRRFHPLAPPSYAERAVPELAERAKQLSRDGSTVMLVAHSQGSVVAASAVAYLLSMGLVKFRRIFIVTHGNPIGRLYRRAFPGYWGGGFLRYLRLELGWGADSGWLNLYRQTDPIGDQVFTGPDEHARVNPVSSIVKSGDWLLADPATRWAFDLDGCPPLAGHSNYLHQEEAIRRLDEIGQGMSHRLISGEHIVRSSASAMPAAFGTGAPQLTVEVRFATDDVGADLEATKAEVVRAVMERLAEMRDSGELEQIATEIERPEGQLAEAAHRLRDIESGLGDVVERIERIVLHGPEMTE